ncbi:transporter substrate-binding domain-containing protein [Verticiella sediminum]|uniref:Transporter substrate-binding domain-containing protein n=1 Tax=Verticiella sediminum TaxID=1247510 RepID=A0A556A8D8_9BURK|nr:transporter substrate-binding domain-containing protein [Verticiella sediminum]
MPRGRALRTFARFAAAAMVLAAGSAQADVLDQVRAAGAVRVAVVQDYPPFGSVGPDMQPQGFDIDLARMLGERLGVRTELVKVITANKIPYLTTGRVDVLLNIGFNEERDKVVDFSQPYAPYFVGVYGPVGTAVASASDLGGRSVSVTAGTIEDLLLTKHMAADTKVMRYEDNTSTISAFMSGQAEFIAIGNIVAATVLAKQPARKAEQKFLMMNSPVRAAVNEGEARLLAEVDAAIGEAKRTGELNRMSERWLAQSLPEGF